jgi:hypothetical protein
MTIVNSSVVSFPALVSGGVEPYPLLARAVLEAWRLPASLLPRDD